MPVGRYHASGASVVVSWPSPSTGSALQHNSNVANTNGWALYGGTVKDSGNNKGVTPDPPTGNHQRRTGVPPVTTFDQVTDRLEACPTPHGAQRFGVR